jgi:hypothetical protein
MKNVQMRRIACPVAPVSGTGGRDSRLALSFGI